MHAQQRVELQQAPPGDHLPELGRDGIEQARAHVPELGGMVGRIDAIGQDPGDVASNIVQDGVAHAAQLTQTLRWRRLR